MRSLAGKGAQLALPVVETDKSLSFANGARASSCRRAVRHPAAAAERADVEPDIILVPLVGFDRPGHRIGYGVGYYDRALKAHCAAKARIAIGIAFATQEIDAIVASSHDERLDLVLTERD